MNVTQRLLDRELDNAVPDVPAAPARPTEQEAATIASVVRARAERKKSDAGYNGEWTDGGAHADLEKLEMWLMGLRGQVPAEYKQIRQEAALKADMEYAEYQRLKKRFERNV